MGTTPVMGFPEIAASQANAETTHNEALVLFQAIMSYGVKDKDLSTPPGSPVDGDTYIVAAGGTGAWSGKDDLITIRFNGVWRFVPGFDDAGTQIPMGIDHEGLLVFVKDEGLQYVWSGSPLAWIIAPASIADGSITSVKLASNRLKDIADNLTATSGLVEKTGAETFGPVTITTAGKALIDDASAADQLTTLGTAGSGVVLSNLGITLFNANIEDDAFASLAVGTLFKSFVIITGNVGTAGVAGLRLRSAAVASLDIAYQFQAVITVVAGDGPLTGTTGPDGFLNIRADSTGGNLYIENRTGVVRGYIVHLLR